MKFKKKFILCIKFTKLNFLKDLFIKKNKLSPKFEIIKLSLKIQIKLNFNGFIYIKK